MHAPVGLPFLPAGSRPKGKIRLPQQDLARKKWRLWLFSHSRSMLPVNLLVS
jgi:hypothetical protein